MRISQKIGIVFLLILGLIVALPEFTAGQSGFLASLVDRFNPTVMEEAVYVKTADQDTEKDFGNYEYTQSVWTKEGEQYTVTFTSPTKLKVGHYLKLKAKGRYVINYQEVRKNQLPEKVKANLE